MKIFLKPKNDSRWHEVFRYEPSTGNLTNRVARGHRAKAGCPAGWLHPTGYIVIGIFYEKYAAHRVIWEMVYGPIPDKMEIDHINGVRDDNRLSNLRLVSHHTNTRNRKLHSNNTSGFQGVGFHKKSGKYRARIGDADGRKYLGMFDTAEQAHEAYQAAARELGYHKNHGRVL